MKITLSSKGQLVIPAPLRRKYRLRARSKIDLEERDDGLFIRPATGPTASIPPIDNLPFGAINYTARDRSFIERAAVEVGPDDVTS